MIHHIIIKCFVNTNFVSNTHTHNFFFSKKKDPCFQLFHIKSTQNKHVIIECSCRNGWNIIINGMHRLGQKFP